MKIAFWSNGGEKMCVTANMASIASMVSLRNAGRVKEILLENHFSRNKSLEDVLLQPMQQDFLRVQCKIRTGLHTKEDLLWR